MSSSINKTLSAAVLRLMRPLIRVLLRHGIPYGAFADLVKWVYVDVADKEFGVPGRKQTVSRVSVLTGLSRKEVARVQKIETPQDEAVAQEYNRAARVISGWLRDHTYLQPDGEPAILPFEGAEQSFSSLVKIYSGDMPARAVLDELRRVKSVIQHEDGGIQLIAHAYIPAGGEEEKLHILGTDVYHLLNTIDHNLERGESNPFYQRKVAYDNLPEEILPRLRELSGARSQALLLELDRLLAEHDRDINPNANGTGRKRAGVGIYYFEDDVNDAESSEEK